MLVGDNFTENFTVDVDMEISETSKAIITAVSLGEFSRTITIKSD